MHAENVGEVIDWHSVLNVRNVFIFHAITGNYVSTSVCKFVLLFIHNLWIIEILENHHDCTTVLRISHSATIVGFCYHVPERIIRNFIIMVKELSKLIFRYTQVRH